MSWLRVHIRWWLRIEHRFIPRNVSSLTVYDIFGHRINLQFPSHRHILSVLATLLSYKRFSWLSGSHRKFELMNESTCTQTGFYFAGNRCFHRVTSCSKNSFNIDSVIIHNCKMAVSQPPQLGKCLELNTTRAVWGNITSLRMCNFIRQYFNSPFCFRIDRNPMIMRVNVI